jgi:NTE family protein
MDNLATGTAIPLVFATHRLKDKDEREYLSLLPTAFHLEAEQVDRLRAAAKRLLHESAEFQRLAADLNKQ